MALDVSKQVANHIATARSVVSSVEHHGSIVIDPLVQELKKFSPVVTNFSELFLGLTTYLNGITQNMQNADIALAQERSDDPQYREKRDASFLNLTKIISRVKGVLPDTLMAQYGLSGTTPYNPDELINYGLKILGLVRNKPELMNSAKDSFSLLVNVDSIIEALTGSINDLTNSLLDVKREEREVQASLEERNKKIAEWKNAYVGVASILAGFYQLAARVDLADRIRPTGRKTAGSVQQTKDAVETQETQESEVSN